MFHNFDFGPKGCAKAGKRSWILLRQRLTCDTRRWSEAFSVLAIWMRMVTPLLLRGEFAVASTPFHFSLVIVCCRRETMYEGL